jgi:hypothetical protein
MPALLEACMILRLRAHCAHTLQHNIMPELVRPNFFWRANDDEQMIRRAGDGNVKSRIGFIAIPDWHIIDRDDRLRADLFSSQRKYSMPLETLNQLHLAALAQSSSSDLRI